MNQPPHLKLKCERLEDRDVPAGIVALAPENGLPLIRVLDADTLTQKFQIAAFDSSFRGGVRVAVGDVNFDGTPDVIAAAGPGDVPIVRVFSGKDGAFLQEIFAYEFSFRGGVFVAAGDVNKDGFADVIVSRGSGVSAFAQVQVFSGKDRSVLLAYDATLRNFRGEIHVAVGDVDKDGFADVVTGLGLNGRPEVRVVSGKTKLIIRQFDAFGTSFRGGVTVAAGDVDGDGYADIIAATQFGGRQVRVFDGRTTFQRGQFFAEFGSLRSGLQVGTVRGADGRADIITNGVSGRPNIRDGQFPFNALRNIVTFGPPRPTFVAGWL